jgi:hypothetical protein
MATNHLENLVAEWYECKGYFIRRNVKVGRRLRGGYEGELDIVGFNPRTKHLVHIEPSLDANSWAERERRYAKKFDAGKRHIPGLFKGLDLPKEIEQIALFVFASNKTRKTLAGGKVMLVAELLEEIFSVLKSQSIYTNMIDEQKPLLRTLQFVAEYRRTVFTVLTGAEI